MTKSKGGTVKVEKKAITKRYPLFELDDALTDIKGFNALILNHLDYLNMQGTSNLSDIETAGVFHLNRIVMENLETAVTAMTRMVNEYQRDAIQSQAAKVEPKDGGRP